jgi:hypothetical protein
MSVEKYKAMVARERRAITARNDNRVDSPFLQHALLYSMCRRVVLDNCGFKRLNNGQSRAVARCIMWLEWKTGGNRKPMAWKDIPAHARPCVGDVPLEQPTLPI